MRAILRSFLAVAVAVTLAGCRHRPPVTPRPLFPMTATWTRPVPATVEGPLAADAISVFVATRDGAVRALDGLAREARGRAVRLAANVEVQGAFARLAGTTFRRAWRRGPDDPALKRVAEILKKAAEEIEQVWQPAPSDASTEEK